MPFKVVINILALLALVGFATFGALAILDLQDTPVIENPKVDVDNIPVDNPELVDEATTPQVKLIDLREESKKIQDTIVLNKKNLSETAEILVDLENQKWLVGNSIKQLEIKKAELELTLVDLLDQVEELRRSQEARENDEINDRNKLASEILLLEKKNKNLENEIVSIKNSKNEAYLELKTKFTSQNRDFDDLQKKALISEGSFEKRIAELTARINSLVMENKNNLDALADQKVVLAKQIQSQKNVERKLALKSNKKIETLKSIKSKFEQLNGLRVIFSGNMIYDDSQNQIVFRADNSIGIPIFQDDFTGSIAGKCGLPIDEEIENRCSATIIAEFVVENEGLFLRGKEIVEIVRK